MDQVKRIVGSLTGRQLTTILVVAVLVAGGIYGLTQWQREAGFRPLYTTLAPEDAALMVQHLKESGVAYRLSANGTVISVPEDRIAELRLDMAAAGLPKSGRIGFEIFDKTNLGMTDFAEHINYRRALEGEIAALAAERATRTQLAAMKAALRDIDRQVAAGGDGVDEDLRFHRALAEATGNPQFGRLMEFLEQYLRDAMRVTRGIEARRDDFMDAVREEHRAIVEAIASRDVRAARKRALEHMTQGERRLQASGLVLAAAPRRKHS